MDENRLMCDLYEENQRLKERIKELEEKHFSECGQIAHYEDELRKAAERLTELRCIKEKIESGDLSDGYHTYNQLYHQRAMLFATIVNQNSDKAWKTHKHEDGEPCFGGGWFLVTIDTPQGAYGYHYEDKYRDLFRCKELEKAKHWDGYTEEDVGRLFSL